MINFTLNVGLMASDRFPEHVQSRVLRKNTPTEQYNVAYICSSIISDFQDLEYTVMGYGIVQSDSEPTLVLQLQCGDARSLNTVRANVLGVSNRYAQDCIALTFDEGKTGELIGQHAELWGEFNPKYFIPMV